MSALQAELLAIHETQPSALLDAIKVTADDSVEKQSSASPNTPQWQPSFHLRAPHGWLNDPCGLGYDPSTGLYHVAFQWNPKGNDWGNISWGHSTSSDLISWKTSPDPCLTPSAVYDRCGIFTGCLRATDIHGNLGSLTYIYTSVTHLPIHYTLPYVAGCESLSLAVSHDGGLTWERQSCNPILPGSPSNVNVTGWRDPYIGTWPSMQNEPSTPSSDLYGFLSGGIVGETPTVFVYAVNHKDLREWKYVGHLADVGLNFSPSRWSGDFGVNWEVASLMILTDDEGVSRDFVVMGTEGCLKFDEVVPGGNRMKALEKRTKRQQLWMSMKLNSASERHDPSGPLAKYSFAGVFDHGCYYAANSFYDPKTAQHIVYGWITEEDLPDGLRHRQGWSGLISLPRVVKLVTLHNVSRARHAELKSITSIETEANVQGTYTIRTLGVQPDERLKKLRTRARSTELKDLELYHLPLQDGLPLETSRWEVEAEFAVKHHCTRVGFKVAHSVDFSSRTILSWESLSETFTVERPQIHELGINHGLETAPHTLFTFSNKKGEEQEETLRIRAILDMSVLEVFVNERTAISTRIYSAEDRCFGLRFFAQSDESHTGTSNSLAAVLLRANVWDGLEA